MLKKNFLIIGIGTIFTKIFAYFLVPILSFAFTKSQFSTIDLINTAIELIIPITTLSVVEAIFRFAANKESNKGCILQVGLILWLIGVLLCLPTVFFLDLGFYGSNYLLLIYLSLYSLFNILTFYLKGLGKIKSFTLFSVMYGSLSFALILIFVFVLKLEITGYYLGFISALAVTLLLIFIVSKPFSELFKSKFDKKLFVEMIKFSAPLVLSNVCWWILSGSDKYITLLVLGSDASGILAIVHKIPTILFVFNTIFSSAFKISAYSEQDYSIDKEESHSEQYSTIYSNLLVCLIIVVSLITTLIEPFTKLFISESFYESYKYIPLYSLSVLICCLCVFFDAIYGVIKKNGLNLISVLVGAILNIVLCLIFTKYMNLGLYGVALSTVIAQAVNLLIRRLTTYKYVKLQIDLLPYIGLLILAANIIVVSIVSNLVVSLICSAILTVLTIAIFLKRLLKLR